MWTPFCLVQVEVTSGMGFTCCLLGALCYARAKHGQLLDRGFEEQGQRLRFFHSWPQLFVESVFWEATRRGFDYFWLEPRCDGAAHSSRWRPPGGDRAFDNAIPAKLAHSNSDRQHACLMQRILSGAQRSILEEALKGGHSHSFAGCAKYDWKQEDFEVLIFAVLLSRQCGKNPVLDSYAHHIAETKQLWVPRFCCAFFLQGRACAVLIRVKTGGSMFLHRALLQSGLLRFQPRWG